MKKLRKINGFIEIYNGNENYYKKFQYTASLVREYSKR